MPSESSSDVKFEIGHVLFIDIVGYSKLLINEQSEHLHNGRLDEASTQSGDPRFEALAKKIVPARLFVAKSK
jgi:hypothetical protein